MEVDEDYFPDDEDVLLEGLLKTPIVENFHSFHANSSSIFWQIIFNTTQNWQFQSNITQLSTDFWNRTKFFISSDHWIKFWNSSFPLDMYYKTTALYFVATILFLLIAIFISKMYNRQFIQEATRLQLQLQKHESPFENFINNDKQQLDWNNFDSTPTKRKEE